MNRKSFTLAAAAFLALAGASGIASAEMTRMVGGAAMYPSKNIIQNAVNSKDNTTLVAAVKAAGLVDTLEGPGPFTVFAPTNAAFSALPAGTVETLLKPENKGDLTGVLTYHVLPGAPHHGRSLGRDQAGRRTGRVQKRAGRAADHLGKGQDLRDHRFEGPHGERHHRRRAAIEWRDPRHQQGSTAVSHWIIAPGPATAPAGRRSPAHRAMALRGEDGRSGRLYPFIARPTRAHPDFEVKDRRPPSAAAHGAVLEFKIRMRFPAAMR